MGKLTKAFAVLSVLVSGAAFAHPGPCGITVHPATAVVAPPPPQGHYETREMNEWIPAHWVQVRHGHHHMRYQFIAGHYELVAKQIWVNAPIEVYGRVSIAPPPPATGVQFGLSYNG